MTISNAIGMAQRRGRKMPLPTEHQEQAMLVAWAHNASHRAPELRLLFAIPNAAKRSLRMGAYMKAEGLSAGVPDLMLATGRELAGGQWINGLFLEMKRQGFSASNVSAAQRQWHERLTNAGYMVKVCGGFEDARNAICSYLGIKP